MLQLLSSLIVLQSEANDELPFDEGTFLLIVLLSFIIFLVISIGVGYWVYKDASKRDNNELAWAGATGGLLFFFVPAGVIAVIAYFVLREEVTTADSVQDSSTEEKW